MLGQASAFADDLPSAIAATGMTVVKTLHAEGAQIYECKASSDNKAAWQFREPVAALFENGRTIGTHFAGPSWRIGDTTLEAKVVAKVPGGEIDDVPWLKLEVVRHSGAGPLDKVTTIQRIHTKGGNFVGTCADVGSLHAVAYSADYVFLKP